MPGEINRFLCHRVVEHIKGCEILFDLADLEEEEGLDTVLKSYNWYLILTDKEKQVIFSDLRDIALRHEMAEVGRSMNADDFLSEQDIAVQFAEGDALPPGTEAILA